MPKQIWLVETGYSDCWYIVGAFKSKEAAAAAVENCCAKWQKWPWEWREYGEDRWSYDQRPPKPRASYDAANTEHPGFSVFAVPLDPSAFPTEDK